ncbi:aminoacyl-histidine dipeptidase [bacterium]|nr:aminoacyl-histidine dipeptidase [bacterium]RQV96352.1 MAG: aminoacyl-histidine dipeptidase [bacterium]
MGSVLTNLKPALLWHHFDEIRKIPHCSKQEALLAKYVLSIAEKNGIDSKQDTVGNIVIQKPASMGCEKAISIVIQSHLDMVCEKNADVDHDFTKDPIQVKIEGEWVTACGTTLGADNGIGMAAALAVLEDSNLRHGPLELLFTVDEESGLTGAGHLKPDFLHGRTLLNLDSEEEGSFFIGCAGGGDTELTLPIKRLASDEGEHLCVVFSGCRGGHSGIDIHTGRGNAIQLLARLLFNLKIPFNLINLEGGNKHNAIPREASATVVVPKTDVDKFKRKVKDRFQEIRFEYKTVEKEMTLNISPASRDKTPPMKPEFSELLLAILLAIPHGVLAMSQEIPDLVETSNNLAIIRTKENEVTISTSSRSSVGSALEAARTKIEAIGKLGGAQIKHLEGYPAWTPNLQSPLLNTMKTIYQKLVGKKPEVKAIHAGLECGIIGEKYPEMDMISFGPDLKHPHSPDEKVHIGSVERFWKLLVATLENLSQQQ